MSKLSPADTSITAEGAIDPAPLLSDVAGKGESIILVPGGLSGWLSWLPFVEPLALDMQVARVQLRSIELAETGGPYPSTYSPLVEREALRATVDQLGLDRFDLVGWSYGGLVALSFAMEYPRHVRTLTLVEPDAVWILRATGHAASAVEQREAFERSWVNREITVDEFKNYLVLAGLGQPGDDFESMPTWPVWVRNRQVVSLYGTIWDYADSFDRLRMLDMPVLLVRGSETTEDLSAIVDDLVATVPRARLLELPGSHASHIENQEHFLTELARHTADVLA